MGSTRRTAGEGSAEAGRGMRARVGLALGPLLLAAVLVVPPPGGLGPAGWRVAGAGLWMAAWWVTEAVPIPATALLPLVLFPLLGVADVGDAAAPYANPLIFLFLGGFLLALGMERWGLPRRVALRVVDAVGVRPRAVIGGFMASAAFLSMWVSNTATAMIMLPIGVSVLELVGGSGSAAPGAGHGPGGAGQGAADPGAGGSEPGGPGPEAADPGFGEARAAGETAGAADPAGSDGPSVAAGELPREGRNFGLGLMLGIAYACSVGGLATLVGTPPNAFLAGFFSETYGVEVGFAQWLAFGLPLSAVGLVLVHLVVTRLVYPVRLDRIPGGRGFIRGELEALGPPARPERRVAAVFALVAVLWITRPVLSRWMPALSDAGIAVAGGLLLFLLPAGEGEGEPLLRWRDAERLPWGVLVLFGGGLSLASAIQATGLTRWIGQATEGLAGYPVVLVIAGPVAVTVLLTELTSNTATAAAFLPILASVAVGAGQDPRALAVPAALAASCAFMLPVATPPNAIVYGSGAVTVPEMARAGVWLNLLFVVLVTAAAVAWLPVVFGVEFGVVPGWAG